MLNVLHIIYLYQRMKEDASFRIFPHTFIFGAKAAPSYHFAKKVIELIVALGNLINNDPEISPYMKIVFIENYDVSKAEIIMPAADISEQISTAGKEASGTGNMKFMMNGALTLGTLDGANVEISELVGSQHSVIFGMKEHEVTQLRNSGSYNPWNYYHSDIRIRKVMDALINGSLSQGNGDRFRAIYDEIMYRNDEYFLLADFNSYVEAQEKTVQKYQDRSGWALSCLVNIAQSGYFSSDRSVKEYADDIWHVNAVSHR
jgi:starch phosphorylase